MSKCARLTILVEKRDDGWAVVLLETGKILNRGFSWKRYAITIARENASILWCVYGIASELKIRNLDGTLRNEATYGRDPRKTEG